MIGGVIDPIRGKTVDSEDLLCNGWISENEDIEAIKIFLDDVYLGEASFGTKMGGYKNYFSFYKSNILDDGHHVIRIKFYKHNILYGELEPQEILVDKSIAVIQLMNVQLTNRCNLYCRWCSVSQFEKKGGYEFFSI